MQSFVSRLLTAAVAAVALCASGAALAEKVRLATSAGDYGKSRAELEETIRLNPGYAPAHENLGDVHALLAAQSYARALRLEPASATLPRKLALVRQLTAISSEPKAAPPQPAAPASAVRR